MNVNQLTKPELEKLTNEIVSLKNKAVLNFIEIGKRLNKVKLALPHGEFGKYLKDTVKFTSWTANKFMTIAEQTDKEQDIKKIEDITSLGVEKAYLILESQLTEVMEDEVNIKDLKTKEMVKKKVKDLTVRELNALIQQKKKLEQVAEEKEVAKELNEKPQKLSQYSKIDQKDIVDEIKVQIHNCNTKLNTVVNKLLDLNKADLKGFDKEPKADILLSIKGLRSVLNEKSKALKEAYKL